MTAKKKPAKRVKANAGGGGASAAARRKLFVEAFLSNGRNALQAAISAGFSEKTAGSQGSRLLKNAEVQQLLDSRNSEICQKLEISTERILQERARLAFFDPRKLFDKNGQPIPIHELDDDTAAALAGLDVMEEFAGSGEDRKFIGYTKKYKLASKNESLTALEKHLGMYERDNKQKANLLDNLPRELVQLMVERLRVLSSGVR